MCQYYKNVFVSYLDKYNIFFLVKYSKNIIRVKSHLKSYAICLNFLQLYGLLNHLILELLYNFP